MVLQWYFNDVTMVMTMAFLKAARVMMSLGLISFTNKLRIAAPYIVENYLA
jgi:hypothetical protein